MRLADDPLERPDFAEASSAEGRLCLGDSSRTIRACASTAGNVTSAVPASAANTIEDLMMPLPTSCYFAGRLILSLT